MALVVCRQLDDRRGIALGGAWSQLSHHAEGELGQGAHTGVLLRWCDRAVAQLESTVRRIGRVGNSAVGNLVAAVDAGRVSAAHWRRSWCSKAARWRWCRDRQGTCEITSWISMSSTRAAGCGLQKSLPISTIYFDRCPAHAEHTIGPRPNGRGRSPDGPDRNQEGSSCGCISFACWYLPSYHSD